MKLYPDTHYSAALHENDWAQLKRFTDARIALGRAGCSIPTNELLKFQLAHAQAKDAVLCQLNIPKLQQQLEQLQLEHIHVQSQASNKELYLKHPDLGRVLSDESRTLVKEYVTKSAQTFDVVIVAGDGLSALAIEENAIPFIQLMRQEVQQQGWSLAPVILATGSRVALGDEIAQTLQARMLIMLIGERPGLSSPDSMGVYYTWQAKTGCQDSARNCISNIRPAGLSLHVAAQRLIALMQNSARLQLSGVHLKDEHTLNTEIKNQSVKYLF